MTQQPITLADGQTLTLATITATGFTISAIGDDGTVYSCYDGRAELGIEGADFHTGDRIQVVQTPFRGRQITTAVPADITILAA